MDKNKQLETPDVWIKASVVYPFFLLLFIIGFVFQVGFQREKQYSSAKKLSRSTTNNEYGKGKAVLGARYGRNSAPSIYIYEGDDKLSSGGVIPIASTDEPAVYVYSGSSTLAKQATIDVYSSTDDAVLDYLTHDKNSKQLKKTPDKSKIKLIKSFTKDIDFNKTSTNKILLPIGEQGIWYITIKVGAIAADAFVVRSSMATVLKEGDNQYIFWGQDFKSKRSLTDGVVIVYNLEDSRKELGRASFGSDGIAKTSLLANADIALVAHGDDRAIVPINLKYINSGLRYDEFQPKERLTKYFIFTDRPLYKPGDTVYFKAILRDDDDAQYSILSGSVHVKVYKDYSEENTIIDTSYQVSSDGTVNGEYTLPEDAKTGTYTLQFNTPNEDINRGYYWSGDYNANHAYFDVQYYRKPEMALEIETDKRELIAGDTANVTLVGSYFSGQPLTNQKITYSIRASDFFEYAYESDRQYMSKLLSDDYRYGYWNGDKVLAEKTVTLDKTGRATIDIPTKLPNPTGKSQVFSIEATIADGSQNPTFARKNILIYAGDFAIYRKDYTYGTKVNTSVQLPVVLTPYRNGKISNVALKAKVHRDWWVEYKDTDYKYPQYKQQSEDLPSLEATSDEKGNATFSFTLTKEGSYTLTVEGHDEKGNLISKKFYIYISNENYSYFSSGYGTAELTVQTDKQKYKPTDTAKLTLFSSIPNRDVLLTVERGYVKRYQVVKIDGKERTIDLQLSSADIPNIYASVTSFSDDIINENTINIPISAESKVVDVRITPNSKQYGPGETVKLNIDTTDAEGTPVSAELAVWAVDKAIFELSDTKLGNIFDTFWHERYNSTDTAHSLEGIVVLQGGGMGGCFLKGTKVLMADRTEKNIEDIKEGEYVLTKESFGSKTLVKAKVINTTKAQDAGYIILNNSLHITPDHMLWVNGFWKEAGSVQVGDRLLNDRGTFINVRSVEWQQGKVSVYNLDIEKYHTFFANDIWVHNQKGSPRSTFNDTAYWNPSVHTDAEGRAQLTFKLPDNLTTWTIAGVATTADTKVGQATTEIVATKDVIVRPLLPNILRTGDSAVLKALIQNFTDKDQVYDITLNFDSGKVELPSYKGIKIASHDIKEMYWNVKADKENEKAKVTVSAKPYDKNAEEDTIIQTIPVKAFGFHETRGETGIGSKSYTVKLSKDSRSEKSQVTLSLAPTIVGVLPTAMNYLIEYPYGCVEQTTSSFVPAVIAKSNQGLFGDFLKIENYGIKKDIDDILKKGINRLASLQKYDGGWTWWFSGDSDVYVTAYVVEYLVEAKKAGVKVDEDMLMKAKGYLERTQYFTRNGMSRSYSEDEYVARNWGLIVLGSDRAGNSSTQISSADLLALAVMTNYARGDKDPQTNGLARLQLLARKQGDAFYWEAGDSVHFSSRDASTALAVRAILYAGGDRTIAAKGVQYLTRSRKNTYWSNTYGTAQVIRALIEFAKTGDESKPNYNYVVKLDGKVIKEGSITDSNSVFDPITIPLSSIQSDGSKLEVTQKGTGQLYSTVIIDEFHTDRTAKAVSSGLVIKREYVNEQKGDGYTLGVGDTAIVKLTVSGLGTSEPYGVIEDQLPAGLVPINESFKNEQYDQTYSTTMWQGVSDREITENGIVLSLYEMKGVEQTYTYRARVVNKGTFIVPPATTSLMYAPEVHARTGAETLVITQDAQEKPREGRKSLLPFNAKDIRDNQLLLLGTVVVIFGLVLFSIEETREKIKKRLRDLRKKRLD